MMHDILDSFLHAIESDDLRWCGESRYLVQIAAPDASLTLNEDTLEGVLDSHLRLRGYSFILGVWEDGNRGIW